MRTCTCRDFAIMQRPTLHDTCAVSGLQGWEDLPDGLLHSILPLLGSFQNLLAFAATCPSWRAAFSSYPSKCTLSPPLLIKPNYIRAPAPLTYFCEPKLPPDPFKLRACKAIDPANPNTTMRCQIHQESLPEMHFAGSSYGQLIFCNTQRCLVVDPFSGAKVSPPYFAVSVKCGEVRFAEASTPLGITTFHSTLEEIREVYRRCRVPNPSDRNSPFCALLTAPLASPSSSHLLVTTRFSLFDWPVGSDSWYELRLRNAQINQIVEFKGQFIAMDDHHRIYKVQLAPRLGLQEIATEKHTHRYSWLVVCGDMLLAVAHFQIRRLDMTTKPAKWVEVKNLDNWALFLGGHAMSQPLAFMCPERWGGGRKCMYYARYSPSWSVYSLGDDADMSVDYGRSWPRKMEPLWLYPSMFYL